MASKRTIKVKKYQDIIEELPAGGAILPGSLVDLQADGTVDANAAAGAIIPVSVALEDELQGKSTRDSYASGDPVQVWHVQPGEVFLAVVDAAFSPAIGDVLEASATTGQLQAITTGHPIGQVVGAKIIDEDTNHRVPVRAI